MLVKKTGIDFYTQQRYMRRCLKTGNRLYPQVF